MSRTYDVGQAHQYKIRQQKAIEEDGDQYWKDANLTLSTAIVRPVELYFAKKIVEEYEWLGCMAALNFFAYGIFFEGSDPRRKTYFQVPLFDFNEPNFKEDTHQICGGVVVFGQEYTENLGVWDKYNFTGKIILLNRGVCLHWTPKNTGSKLIMEAIKQLPSQYEIITCTVDHLAGEIGTIYQACNFHYIGSMRENNPNVNNGSGDRFGVIINDKLYGSRAIRQKIGSQKKADILERYPDAQFVKQKSKCRYFLFRGNKKIRKSHLKSISHLLQPYPKRKSG